MPVKTFVISNVSKVKSGETDDGKPWTLYHVLGREPDGKNVKMSTFSGSWAQHLNETVTAEVELQTRGQYTNLVLGAFPQPEDEPARPATNGQKMASVESQLAEILAILKAHFR